MDALIQGGAAVPAGERFDALFARAPDPGEITAALAHARRRPSPGRSAAFLGTLAQ